jgi:phospholipid/cholesterol/gamma-HCH transport system substrate-binding protein
MAREQTAETIVGAAVLGAAGLFLAYALGVGGVGGTSGGYEVTARFGQVGGLAPGADVRLAGVKVGTVADVTLDPKTFMAVTRLSLRDDVLVPADSTAKVTSDGLLGGSHLAIAPGGSPENLQPGGSFENAQGAVDLFGLIGQVMRPAAAAAQPAPAASVDPYPGE